MPGSTGKNAFLNRFVESAEVEGSRLGSFSTLETVALPEKTTEVTA